MIVVSDSATNSIIEIGFSILQEIFGKIIIPEEVWKEVVERGKNKPGSDLVAKSRG